MALTGDIVGDSISYVLGRRGGSKLIEKWGRYIGLTIERVQKIERHYANHTGKTLILGKFAYALETPFLVAAGLAKVPYRKFLLYVFVSSIPKSLLFILIGYYFGHAYGKISRYLDYTALMTAAVAVLLTIIYFLIRKISKKHMES